MKDCAFRYDLRFPCGGQLLWDGDLRWGKVVAALDDVIQRENASLQRRLPISHPFWLLPCTNEQAKRVCFWTAARLLFHWQPKDGAPFEVLPWPSWRLDAFPGGQLVNLLKTRSVLFVGDSTLRGLMYALLEHVNHSLETWRQSHDILVFQHDLHGGRYMTVEDGELAVRPVIAFAYFPLFWQTNPNRLNLTKAVTGLLNQ
nr:unnamed protein product [Spirometra erinaceieuropaei]